MDLPRLAPTRLGEYEIVRKLARGGMAQLFLARKFDPDGSERLVVLKRILPSYAENPKFVRLFLDEAKLVATLDHPNIARVYDMGRVDGNYYFTMEYVHGQDVRATLKRLANMNRKLSLDHAVQIARDIAAALHHAHERRHPDGALLDVVHRDVSPSNIVISYDGAVKLVDFGVAKVATSTVKTRTGTLKGKIAYMSPEQAKGAPIDRRSDIFSLGIVLWEMVTTQRLFRGDNDLATIQMIVNSRAPAPSQLRPECPPELDRIIGRALANEPDARYQTAEQLLLDLEELARTHAPERSPTALRTFMHDLFRAEIEAWNEAQAAGMTLIDHVLAVTDLTSPIEDSELDSYAHDDLDEAADSEELTVQAPMQSDIATDRQVALPIPATLQLAVPPPPARPSVPALSIVSDQPAPFPLAPPEWRQPAEPANAGVAPDDTRAKQILIAASIGFAVIVLLVIAFVRT